MATSSDTREAELKIDASAIDVHRQSDTKTVSNSTSKKRNAFSELMTPKSKRSRVELPNSTSVHKSAIDQSKAGSFTSGLLSYITKPELFPSGTIIRQTEHTVLIRDLYPKALVHLLLLPQKPELYSLAPFDAFNAQHPKHNEFLSLMRTEAASAAQIAASELSRLVSPYSESCKSRNEALDSDDPPAELPLGRDFLQDIKIGVHAQPSMATLHIHIISADNWSKCLKHKKHYNSFNTEFFVSLDEFPLQDDDYRTQEGNQTSLLKGNMTCWRCGTDFGNKFKQLKEHLDKEYEEWRKV